MSELLEIRRNDLKSCFDPDDRVILQNFQQLGMSAFSAGELLAQLKDHWLTDQEQMRLFWKRIGLPRFFDTRNELMGFMGLSIDEQMAYLFQQKVGNPQEVIAILSKRFPQFDRAVAHMYLSQQGRGGTDSTRLLSMSLQEWLWEHGYDTLPKLHQLFDTLDQQKLSDLNKKILSSWKFLY